MTTLAGLMRLIMHRGVMALIGLLIIGVIVGIFIHGLQRRVREVMKITMLLLLTAGAANAQTLEATYAQGRF